MRCPCSKHRHFAYEDVSFFISQHPEVAIVSNILKGQSRLFVEQFRYADPSLILD